jgi:hypothetical protein
MEHTKLSLIFDKSELTETEHSLLFLMPLVEMAWVHGAISPRENISSSPPRAKIRSTNAMR